MSKENILYLKIQWNRCLAYFQIISKVYTQGKCGKMFTIDEFRYRRYDISILTIFLKVFNHLLFLNFISFTHRNIASYVKSLSLFLYFKETENFFVAKQDVFLVFILLSLQLWIQARALCGIICPFHFTTCLSTSSCSPAPPPTFLSQAPFFSLDTQSYSLIH